MADDENEIISGRIGTAPDPAQPTAKAAIPPSPGLYIGTQQGSNPSMDSIQPNPGGGVGKNSITGGGDGDDATSREGYCGLRAAGGVREARVRRVRKPVKQ